MLKEVTTELEDAIEKAQASLKRDLAKLRTGRAHAGMLDGIRVDLLRADDTVATNGDGGGARAQDVDRQTLEKDQIKNVERALRESDLGLNPLVDGLLIRVPIPPLTEDRRRDLVKIAKKTAEDCRVSVRKARHEALDMLAELKKEGAASEDDIERAKKRVEEIVGASGQAIDGVVQNKEKEILAI